MAKKDSHIDALRRRWAATDSILKWTATPRDRRQRVLAELEETARGASGLDPQLAADLSLAVDALDIEDNAPLLELLVRARADIHFLLARISAKP